MATEIVTFGCRLNTFESEVMRQHADSIGLEHTVIVNTCAVTAEAERQARQTIRRIRREHPDAHIIVTGCAAAINPQAYAAMPEVNQVLGNTAKMKAESFAVDPRQRMVPDVPGDEVLAQEPLTGFGERARAFIQVQQGCDHLCTFCVIPLARGRSRSLTVESIITQAETLVAGGYRELVLTGVDLTAWGDDLPNPLPLGYLVARLLEVVPALERLRLSSLDPVEIDETLLSVLAVEPRLMPHLHLSIQAGDDMILKRMMRRHQRDDVVLLCERLRRLRPGIALGADLIAGFPTETEEAFAATLDLVGACGLTHLHVFPYSPRSGTAAARMPQLSREIVRDRAARLRDTGAVALRRFLAQQVGTTVRVVVEKPGFGHSEHTLPVRFVPGADLPGEIVTLVVTHATDTDLTGEPYDRA